MDGCWCCRVSKRIYYYYITFLANTVNVCVCKRKRNILRHIIFLFFFFIFIIIIIYVVCCFFYLTLIHIQITKTYMYVELKLKVERNRTNKMECVQEARRVVASVLRRQGYVRTIRGRLFIVSRLFRSIFFPTTKKDSSSSRDRCICNCMSRLCRWMWER